MNPELEQFAIPSHKFTGKLTDHHDILINHNLQQFVEKAGLIAGLACNGKIPLDQAYLDIIEQLTEINLVRVQLRQKT